MSYSHSRRNYEMEVLSVLRETTGLRVLGCQFERGLSGGVCVRIGQNVMGAWWFENGTYKFSRMAYRRAERHARTIDGVIEQTTSIATSHIKLNQFLDDRLV